MRRPSPFAACLASGMVALACALPAMAQDDVDAALGGFDDATDAALGGFDDDATDAARGGFDDDATDAALGGFDDDPNSALGGFDDGDADLDGALEGFDDDDDGATASTSSDAPDRFWDVSGSLSLGASINVVPHRSSIGPVGPTDPPTAALDGTDYLGLQRLRSRGDLQIDVDLPYDWDLRAQGFLWFDFAYLIHDRDSYTDQVIDNYEFVAQVLDLWVEGTLFDRLDVKLGRQVVNWGRSDTLRVTDVLNALDNREPGLGDIENLRLPSTMAKLDYYIGRWSFSALVVPEIRYDINPPAGNDFFTLPGLDDLPPPRPPAIPPIDSSGFADQRADQWGSNPEYGGSIDGIFSGWDVSFYVARIYQNRTTITASVPSSGALDLIETDRVTMVGGGGNYTVGSWLFKGEIAWFKDVDYAFLNPTAPPTYYEVLRAQSGRVDAMGGIEYYGIVDTTLALEIVNRHIIDYDPLFEYFPNYVQENSVEYALRVTTEWMNARLDTTLLAMVLGAKAQGGAILRAEANYDLLDALVLSGGFVAYIPTENPPVRDWGKNQRAFLKLKYSF